MLMFGDGVVRLTRLSPMTPTSAFGHRRNCTAQYGPLVHPYRIYKCQWLAEASQVLI
jgi:hypothetical protein